MHYLKRAQKHFKRLSIVSSTFAHSCQKKPSQSLSGGLNGCSLADPSERIKKIQKKMTSCGAVRQRIYFLFFQDLGF